MVTVETLFEKHTYYVALVKVLRNEIEYSERQLSQDSIERDEEIASMVLSHAAVIERNRGSCSKIASRGNHKKKRAIGAVRTTTISL